MATQIKFDLFISYAHENQEKVLNLLKSLKQKGISPWIDKDQMRRGDIQQIMQQGIDQSKLFLCCATTDYCKSESCLRELRYADYIKKEIIWVLFENFKDSEDRKLKLKQIGWYISHQKYYKHNDSNLINVIQVNFNFKIRINFNVEVNNLLF